MFYVSIRRKLRQMWTNSTEIYFRTFFTFAFVLLLCWTRTTGYLIAPMKVADKSRSSKFNDEKLPMNVSASSAVDYNSNSINDDYLTEANINKTFFRSLNNSLIISQVGSVVQIPCRVHLIGDEMVKSLSRLIAQLFLHYRYFRFHLEGFMDPEKRLSFADRRTHNLQQRWEI